LNYKAQTRGSCCVTPQGARAASTHKGQFAEWVPGSARARAYAQLQQEHTFSFEPPGTLSRTCVDGSGFLRNSRGPTRARAWAILSFPQFRRPPGRTCGNTPEGQIPGTCTGERTRKETSPRFTPQWKPRQARVRAAIPREATVVAPGLPQLIASCLFRTRFQRGCISISCECLTMFLPA
jgi:hypothetical protein